MEITRLGSFISKQKKDLDIGNDLKELEEIANKKQDTWNKTFAKIQVYFSEKGIFTKGLSEIRELSEKISQTFIDVSIEKNFDLKEEKQKKLSTMIVKIKDMIIAKVNRTQRSFIANKIHYRSDKNDVY